MKQYGEGKWAQIAEKLDGRAGKQCRERWHNHLRPDIKVCCSLNTGHDDALFDAIFLG